MSKVEQTTLGDVLSDLWTARIWMGCAAAVGFLVANVFLFSATPYYKSHMIVSPANPMNGAESSSLLADENLFALRYLMQRVGAGSSSDFLRFESTYDGARVADVLLRDPKIRAGLSADQRFAFSNAKERWSAGELSDYIHDRVKLESVGTSNLRRLVYSHPRADFADYFLTALHQTTDDLIRQTTRKEAGQRIAHLRASVRDTNNPDHRRALTSLLMEQERLLMLASVETPYAASVVEPAAADVKVAWPSVPLSYSGFIAVFALIGFAAHGAFANKAPAARPAARAARRPISAKRWFKAKGDNTNRPLTLAAEDKRDVA
ncbi:MAG: hypothetical protein KDJ35_08740 [Alphaproteobacteria bacterium]|nr:hypothetical protein [Alphaproteobacteria bacterium]